VPEPARHVHAPVVEVGDGVRVDARWEGEGRPQDAVFALGDEVRFPFEALDLPRAEDEGRYGDDGWCVSGVLVVLGEGGGGGGEGGREGYRG
jgi:hypothetical protein